MMNLALLQGYSQNILSVVNYILVPVLFAVAFLTFLWGVYNYFILGAADADKQKEGRQFVLWGVIGFVAIVSVWGLVAIAIITLGLAPGGGAPPLPKL
ncbi:MAG: hypothetical protein KGH56_03575 [Patescibacteria group bacterium]|nr:hypothetical protein [Patescibacteria group bacterium]